MKVGALIICLVLLILYYAAFRGLRRGFARSSSVFPSTSASTRAFQFLFGITIWMFIIGALSWKGIFRDFQAMPPRLMAAVIPSLMLVFGLMMSKKFNRLIAVIPLQWLIGIQAFRILMELFIWLGFRDGFIPEQMTFHGLNYDILIGISAIIMLLVGFKNRAPRKALLIVWNILGLITLSIITVVSITSTPSPLRQFMNEPANTFIAEIPFIWIAAFIIPFALLVHLMALKKLIKPELADCLDC